MDPAVKHILESLALEQKMLDQKLELVSAQVRERRARQKLQQTSFAEQILEADYAEDLAQFTRFFHRVLQRNRAVLPEGWEAADLVSELKTFLGAKEELEREKSQLQTAVSEETHALVLQQMKGVDGLQKDYADASQEDAAFQEVYERYQEVAKIYLRALREFTKLKTDLKALTPDVILKLQLMQRELRQ